MATDPGRGIHLLVGRAGELDALREGLEQARAGLPVAMAISGEPGIGKSRLLAELGTLAEESNCLLLSGSAAEFESNEPFGVFRDALDDHVGGREILLKKRLGVDTMGELSACLPALVQLGYQPEGTLQSERYRTHRALRSLLEGLAVDHPVVLTLDDLHWADESTVELLEALLRRRPRGRVLIACALRPGQAQRRLKEALAHDAVLLEPAVLTLEDTRALLADELGDHHLRTLYEESGGVPFYITELARSPKTPQVPPSGAKLRGAGMPRAVTTGLEGEIDSLTPTAAELLRASAVVGDPFEVHLAAAAAGLDDEAALASFDELVERDLLRATPAPRRLRFRHPLVRRAIYESASPGYRITAHRRAAESLESTGAGAEERARHVAASAHPGDKRAAALLAEAGHAAAVRGPATAAHWFDEALRLFPAADAGWRLGLLAARARALVSAGRLEDGLEMLGEARSLLPDEATDLHVRLTAASASVETMLGRHAQACARLRGALAALPDPNSVEAGTLHLALAVSTGVWSNHPHEVVSHAERGLAAATRVGDETLAATAHALLALGELALARGDKAGELLAHAGAGLDACSDEALAGRIDAAHTVGHAACYLERFTDALRWFERGIAVSRRTGQDHMLVPLMNGQTLALATLGRLEAADEVASAAVEAAQLGANGQVLAWALRQRCWVSLLAGEIPTAVRAADRSRGVRTCRTTIQRGGAAATRS